VKAITCQEHMCTACQYCPPPPPHTPLPPPTRWLPSHKLIPLAAAAAAAFRRGEKFDRQRHECGTEVKAITYSAMQIRQAEGDAEVFVIVDI
jgi:hypothetical protein